MESLAFETYWCLVTLAALPLSAQTGTRHFLQMHPVAVLIVGSLLVALLVVMAVGYRRCGMAREAYKQASQSLGEQSARLDALVEAGPDVYWVWDVGHDEVWLSERWADVFALPLAEGQTRSAHLDRWVHDDDRHRLNATLEDQISGRADGPYSIEFRHAHGDGGYRWVRARGRVVGRDATGRAERMAGTLTDITESRRDEAQRDLLVRELNHRVRNTLAVAISHVRDAAGQSGTVDAMRDTLTKRLEAMLHAQRVLWRNTAQPMRDEFSIRSLIDSVVEAHRPRGEPRYSSNIEPLSLDESYAMPLSLIVHELADNAVKHGAWRANTPGRVTLSLCEQDQRVILSWVESFVGPASMSGGQDHGKQGADDEPTGQGISLIRKLVDYHLDGELDMRATADGLVVRIAFTPRGTTKAAGEA